MFKSQIIKMYREYANEMRINKEHEKEYDEVIKYEKAMLEKIGYDEEFKRIFKQYDHALNQLNYADIENVFRKGFIMGAQTMLEICGAEREEQ